MIWYNGMRHGPFLSNTYSFIGYLPFHLTPAGTETPSRTSKGTFFTGDAAKHPLVLEVSRVPCVVAPR